MTEFFPQELVDAILDEVRDFNDLKACSLTCRNFSSHSRALLFQELKLDGRPAYRDAFERFHEFCVASPHIPSLVQTFCIHGYNRSHSPHRGTDTVNSILRFMQNLKVIKFYDATSFTDFCDGSMARLSSHSFREIHLYDVFFLENGFDHMCAILQGSPNLERLSVHHTGPVVLPMFGGDETSWPRLAHTHATRRGPSIRDLSVVSKYDYKCPAFIEAILETSTCPLSINKLQRFAFSLSESIDFQHLSEMLTLSSDTLRVLSLTFNFPNASRDLPLNSLPVVSVGHLSKIAFMITYGRDGPHYLRWWFQSLKEVIACDETPALRVMDLELGPSFSLANPAAQPEWNEFDQILSSPPFDDGFRALTIQVQKRSSDEHVNQWDESRLALPSGGIQGGATPHRSVEVRARHLKAQFPRLAGKGKFSVKIIQ
ncbi:hypothetical protein ARMGADRAFT_1062002 [Armillaria gallica]|uniref:F-box domain-containing protein n=1 Tax=Armillaria gallica TaxID=47427 RepID=A0A2H3DNB4_ARMGA|nr:hypothetical protein ARMGADRAFT_1062002 [Armillaria gallica]